jgi:hypothetical protein
MKSPWCGKRLSWLKVKSSFPCPRCQRELSAQTFGPRFGTIVLWTLAELPLRSVLPASLGIFVVCAFSIVSLGIGYAIGLFVFEGACQVELAD